jgi:hypothetical protein
MLYVDSQFDGSGSKVPVLVAISPNKSIDYKDTGHDIGYKSDLYHHRPAQITTGDGYYIVTPKTYCLTFDGKCAPKSTSRLKSDGYPQPSLLALNSHDPKEGPREWDWSTVVTEHSNTVLILPMPDSFSSDGVWSARFGSKFSPKGENYRDDGPHSIGLQLHYVHGPANVSLLSCEGKGKPSVATCNGTPSDIPRTQLGNSGTVRISMRAPDNSDACDNHVRAAYQEMFSLLNREFNSDKAVIEPAQGMQVDGTWIYEDHGSYHCLEKEDPQNPSNARLSAPTLPSGISLLLTQIDKIVTAFNSLPQDLQNQLLFPEIKQARAGLDPDFPRISQMVRINELVRLSENETNDILAAQTKVRINQKNLAQNAVLAQALTETDIRNLRILLDAQQVVAHAPPVKSGNDCKAMVILVNP